MSLYGLIGYPLSHSFSKRYFTEKFEREGISARYELFELPAVEGLPALLQQNPTLKGLNVTIPHKQTVIPYLTRLASSAEKVGAVNVIKIEPDGTLTGHNSDYTGFRTTLEAFVGKTNLPTLKALVLGSGGAGKAVEAVLRDVGVTYSTVSRAGKLAYQDLTADIVGEHRLIVNSTPLGMYPHIDACPQLPYHALTPQHFVYDLVYNPEETLFLQQARTQGAKTHNGLAMLYEQAEEAWRVFGIIPK